MSPSAVIAEADASTLVEISPLCYRWKLQPSKRKAWGLSPAGL